MRDHVTEELISAYLDGELTDDERELVERTLAESTEHQQMLSELETLSSSLQTLPAQAAPRDLASRVVQQIEQLQPIEPPQPAPATTPSNRRQARWTWQAIAMTAASVAVIFALAWMQRSPDEPREQDFSFTPTPVWMVELPQYLMVYDITLTPVGDHNAVLEGILRDLRIAIDPNLKLNRDLENELLAIRQQGADRPDTKASPYKTDAVTPKSGEQDDVEMIYISSKTGTIHQLGLIILGLESLGDEVSRVHFDMVIEVRKIKMIRKLHESARNEFAQQVDPIPDVNGYAFRLVSPSSNSNIFSLPRMTDTDPLQENAELSAQAARGLQALSNLEQNADAVTAPDDAVVRPVQRPQIAPLLALPNDHAAFDEPSHVLIILRTPGQQR